MVRVIGNSDDSDERFSDRRIGICDDSFEGTLLAMTEEISCDRIHSIY
jgi:hypothetical protein